MIQISDFACRSDCPHAGKPWPAHLPKPTCRIVAELPQHTNPVTVAVYRDILRNRMQGSPLRGQAMNAMLTESERAALERVEAKARDGWHDDFTLADLQTVCALARRLSGEVTPQYRPLTSAEEVARAFADGLVVEWLDESDNTWGPGDWGRVEQMQRAGKWLADGHKARAALRCAP